jgi:hypothetical protein
MIFPFSFSAQNFILIYHKSHAGGISLCLYPPWQTGVLVNFYACIQWIQGSNLGRGTEYLNAFVIHSPSSYIPREYLDISKNASFQIPSNSSLFSHTTIRHSSVYIESAVN